MDLELKAAKIKESISYILKDIADIKLELIVDYLKIFLKQRNTGDLILTELRVNEGALRYWYGYHLAMIHFTKQGKITNEVKNSLFDYFHKKLREIIFNDEISKTDNPESSILNQLQDELDEHGYIDIKIDVDISDLILKRHMLILLCYMHNVPDELHREIALFVEEKYINNYKSHEHDHYIVIQEKLPKSKKVIGDADSNFSFLKKNHTLWFSLLVEAENNQFVDADTCIYKVRKFSEFLAKEILTQEKKSHLIVDSHFENIKLMKSFQLVNEAVLDTFHHLRLAGNKSIHGDESNMGIAGEVLEKAFFLSTSFYKKYWDSSIIPSDYISRINIKKNNIEIMLEQAYMTKEEKDLLEKIILILEDEIYKHIMKVKLDGWGSLAEIDTMRFSEFYTYYIDTLNEFVNMSDNHFKAIIQLKKLQKKMINSNNPDKVNKELAIRIYLGTPWAE